MAYFFCSLLYKNLEPLVKDFKCRILTLQLSQKIVPPPTVGMDSGGGKKVQDIHPPPLLLFVVFDAWTRVKRMHSNMKGMDQLLFRLAFNRGINIYIGLQA